MLTSEGDGLGSAFATNDGRFTLIFNPGTAGQTVTNVRVTNVADTNVNGMDDVLFPGATAGTLYVSDTKTNTVYATKLTGLDPNTPIVSLGSFGEVGLVNPVTGVVGMSLLGGRSAPHGLDFVAATSSAPEPSTWPMLLLGLGGLAMAAAGRGRGRHLTSPRRTDTLMPADRGTALAVADECSSLPGQAWYRLLRSRTRMAKRRPAPPVSSVSASAQ